MRGSPAPRLKFYLWKTLLAIIIYRYLPDILGLGLPINEGYFTLLIWVLDSLILLIPLSWIVRPTVWRAFNIGKASHFIEFLMGFTLTAMLGGGLILFRAVPSYIAALIEPKETVVLRDYYTDGTKNCGDDSDCFNGYRYYLNLEKTDKRTISINKGTYEWLSENEGYEMISTTDGSVSVVHAKKPISLTYKPNAKIAFNIEKLE